MWVLWILFHVGELFPVSFISAYNLFFSRRHGRPLDFCFKNSFKVGKFILFLFYFKFIGTVFFCNDGNVAYLPLELCVKLANIFCFIAKFIKLLLLKMSKELNLGFFCFLFCFWIYLMCIVDPKFLSFIATKMADLSTL